ncbi:MAG: toll/interleukin-1 receptor domain-containing protein [Hyphomicrobium sp.]
MLRRVPQPRLKVPWWRRGRLVFISYRRRDSLDVTGRIWDRLVARFGRCRVILDFDSIPPGFDFRNYIENVMQQCAVVLAIIGPGWRIASDADGCRYVDDPKDMVGFELGLALRLGVRVIPVLVGGARMPTAEELPPSLRALATLQGIAVGSERAFHADVDAVIAGILGRAN